jgi:hypothetical protein
LQYFGGNHKCKRYEGPAYMRGYYENVPLKK